MTPAINLPHEPMINEGYGNYLLVPAGQFTMGDNYDEGSYDNGNPRERPIRTIYLDGDDSAQVPNPISQRRYPWGNEIDGSYADYLDSGDPYDNGLTPVGYYDGSLQGDFQTHNNASPYGAYDMAGNVYEWINDYFGNYPEGAATNPQGPERGSGYVIRGSAFLYETFKQRSAYRGAYYPSFRGEYIGIRCVREVTDVSP